MMQLIISFVLTCLGVGVAVYVDSDGDLVATRDFTQSTAGTEIASNTDSPSNSPSSVGVGDNGNAVIVWQNRVAMSVEASVLVMNTPGTATTLSTTTVTFNTPQVAVTGAGQAVAAWLDDAGALYARTYNGTNWGVMPTQIETGVTDFFNVQAIGIDATGRAILVWEESGVIHSSSFIGTSETDLGTLSTGAASSGAVIAVNSSGKAVAAWVNEAVAGDPVIEAALFDGTSWSSPQTRSAVDASNPRVAIDPSGNAVVTWDRAQNMGNFFLETSSFNVSDMQWSGVTILDQNATKLFINQDVKFNDQGEVIAVWLRSEGGSNRVVRSAAGSVPLLPPGDLTAKRKTNRFPTQSEQVNVLQWEASPSPGVVSYSIFRNGVKIGSVPSECPLVFADHNRGNETDTYEVRAVNGTGTESPPAVVVIGPCSCKF